MSFFENDLVKVDGLKCRARILKIRDDGMVVVRLEDTNIKMLIDAKHISKC